jgi:hypothetical protein
VVISAVITVIIRIYQHRLEKQRFRLEKQRSQFDLYDKRNQVYMATMAYIAAVVQNPELKREDMVEFYQKSQGHEFLFGEEIGKFIEELRKKGKEIYNIHIIYKNAPMDGEQHKARARQRERYEWFEQQVSTARQLFAKYLTLTED